MSIYISVRDNVGKIVFSIGVVILLVGVLTLSILGSMLSAGALFAGILLVVFGLFTQVGLFSGDWRSIGAVGTVLICVSIVLVAYGVVVMEFVEVKFVGTVPVVDRGSILGYNLVLSSERPYLWLSSLLMQSGLAVFIAGLVLKVFKAIRP